MRKAAMLLLAGMLTACHTRQPAPEPGTHSDTVPAVTDAITPPPEENAEAPPDPQPPTTQEAEVPPCLPADNKPKQTSKRRPKPGPRVAAAPAATVAATPTAPAEPSVEPIEHMSLSILGKKVRGQQGEDLGRVVDVRADAEGRVRVAIIEFGGFLGVGNRRIGVDWSLLKFHPNDPDAPVVLDVSRRKLDGTPDFRDDARPLALMAPSAPQSVAAPSADTKK